MDLNEQVKEGALNIDAIKGYFSEHIFRAFCYQSELHSNKPDPDYGTDLKIVELFDVNGKLDDGNTIVNFQIKSTFKWEINDKSIKYSLNNKCYNSMARRNLQKREPLILILCCLNNDVTKWIKYGEISELNCKFYWYHSSHTDLKGNSDSSTTIHIPLDNLLTNSSLTDLVNKHKVRPEIN